ncbi:GGDEF domain-containing protein [Pseudoalteromonas sp. SSDWG2]
MKQALFKANLENNGDAVVVSDIDGGIVFWNAAAKNMFGYSFEEVKGKDPHDILTPASNREFAKHSKAAYASTRKSNIMGAFIRLRALTKNKNKIDVDLQINSVELDSKVYIYTFIRDVSDMVELEKKTDRLINIDALTKVKNRYRFNTDMKWLVTRCQGTAKPLSVGIIDIDYFKSINDKYGHDVGDVALVQFCEMMTSRLPTTAVFARLGGEEIALALPDTDCYEAVQIIEEMRQYVSEQTIKCDSASFKITFSCGLSSLRGAKCMIRSLLKEADKALYQAKEQGRNRTVLFHH